MSTWEHDGLNFHFRELGDGAAFLFQHGLGGDVNQPLGLFRPPAGIRLLSVDCRAHGETRPLGDPEKIGLASFVDDLIGLLDHLGIRQAVVGGISMGAALAVNLAIRFPRRVLGLVLSRPAWLASPRPQNVAIYGLIARLISQHGAAHGLEIFRETEEYQRYVRESPDAAASLVGQFQNPRAEETVIKLERIPNDTPLNDLSLLKTIAVPTLVLANRQDPIHPYEYGETLAATIPGAEFAELTPKSVSRERHAEDVQHAVGNFLTQFISKD